MERESKLIKNTLILSLGTFLPKLASFITLPVLTGYLTKEEYGVYDLVTVLISLLLPAATLQIQTAAFRFLVDKKNDNTESSKIITNIYAFILPISLIVIIGLYIFLPAESVSVKIYICLYFFVDILVNAARQIARGLGKTLDYSISAVVSALFKMIFAVIFVKIMGLGLKGAVMSLFYASFISFVVLIYRIRLWDSINLELIDKKSIQELLAYSWPMVPNSMSMWVMNFSDRVVVTAALGVAANAVYAVANKIPSLLTLAHSPFNNAWQESASLASKDEDANQYYTSMFRTMFDFLAGALGLLICFTPILFKILIKGDYDEAYQQMPILFLAIFCYSMATFLGGIYVAFKQTKKVGITTTISAAINLVFDLLLIQKIGLYAASISTLISYLFLMVFRMIDVQKFAEIRYDMKRILFIAVILLIESFICFQNTLAGNITNAVIGIAAFVILNKELIKMLTEIVKSKIRPVH